MYKLNCINKNNSQSECSFKKSRNVLRLTTSAAYRKVKKTNKPNSQKGNLEYIRNGRRGKCRIWGNL